MKTASQLKKFFLLAGDIVILYAALYLTLVIRYRALPSGFLWQGHFAPFSIVFAGWIVIFYIANLYDLKLATNNTRFWQIIGKSYLAALLFAFAFFYLMPGISIAPKTNLIIFIAIVAILLASWRQFYNWSLAAYLPKSSIAVVGWSDQVRELIEELNEKKHLGFKISFIIDEKSGTEGYSGVPFWRDYGKLTELVRENKVSTIVLSYDPHQSQELRNSLFACLPLSVNFISLPLFYESITGRVPISVINQMWFLENLSEGGKTIFDTIKRFADFCLALVFMLVSLIFWPLIALAIKLNSAGPVFFIQTRLGKNGEPFRLIKFRTMTVAGNDYAPTVTGDKRITAFGNFLRKSRIDEIPQLVNIIKGEMSFVGPRPERPELVSDLEKNIPFYRERMLVKPGLTGWDQVSGEYHSPSQPDTIKKLQYDLFYIKNRSVYLDLSIVLKTIYTVLSREGR
jgi:exopolysaccharide biosynthesis polyprenyl glycosylphosphotransferase